MEVLLCYRHLCRELNYNRLEGHSRKQNLGKV